MYAWSLNIPIATLSSLEVMALSSSSEMVHVPIINARRGYVFAAIYDQANKEMLSPRHIKLEELLQELQKQKDYTFITNDEFEEIENIEKYNPDIEKVVNHFKNIEPINPHGVNPNYLKLTEAEESKMN